MKTFLEHVAAHLLSTYGTDLSRVAVVFPNKRAALFLNDHLARLAGKPLWSPSYITISDLFRRHSPLTVGDQIKLVCDLHKSFVACTGSGETLDHFYGWGQLLLADFDDIDKNMADARRVFANLRDLHELDDLSYLTPEQTEMLKTFFANFTDGQETRLKEKFLSLWSRFFDIYEHYRASLRAQGIAYEGMLYRDVATDETLDFHFDRYLFVGFNMMQRVEQILCKRLMQAGKARFYWDFDAYYMRSPHKGEHEAGRYIGQYLEQFPNELDTADADIYDNLSKPKHIRFLNATTENIQARYIAHWLRQAGRMADGKRTAIVLCDESLLPATIHCLPAELGALNVTTGFPLAHSPFASLVSQLIALQTAGYSPSRDRFRLHHVNKVLSHPYAAFISPLAPQLRQRLNTQKNYYPTPDQLAADEPLARLFSPLAQPLLPHLLRWLMDVVKTVARSPHQANRSPLFDESAFRTYTLLNRVADLVERGELDVDVITFQRLLGQLVQSASIPFHGEPAEGVQLMGVLETRNLDFDHVLMLSCNEGNLPRGINDASFIPYAIRKAYGLTTIDNKVGIYSYYFHRLLQRATDVTICYNSSTDDGHTGEMSRFMLQLLVESPHAIDKRTLRPATFAPPTQSPSPIAKSKEVMEKILTAEFISPTALNRYLRCPLQFYYYHVAGLREADYNDDDEIDNRIFGNIFHYAAEQLYRRLTRQGARVRREDIDALLKDGHEVEMIVDRAFRKELFKLPDEQTRMPQLNGLQIIKREVVVTYLRQLLETDRRLAPFTIAGLECKVEKRLRVGRHMVTVGGIIDRLDVVEADGQERCIRVVDYKTGHAPQRTPADVDEVFDPANIFEKHSDYYLQAMLYALIVDEQQTSTRLPVAPALLFIQHSHAADYDPTLCFGRERIANVDAHRPAFEEHVEQLLTEIFDPDQPFVPTADRRACTQCPYRLLCSI